MVVTLRDFSLSNEKDIAQREIVYAVELDFADQCVLSDSLNRESIHFFIILIRIIHEEKMIYPYPPC